MISAESDIAHDATCLCSVKMRSNTQHTSPQAWSSKRKQTAVLAGQPRIKFHSRSVPATVCHPWNPLPATCYLSASSAAERAADDAPPPRPLRASALSGAPPPQLRPAGSTIGWLDTYWFNIRLNFLLLLILFALPHSAALRLLSFGLPAAAQVGLILLIMCAPSPSSACASARCGAPPPQLRSRGLPRAGEAPPHAREELLASPPIAQPTLTSKRARQIVSCFLTSDLFLPCYPYEQQGRPWWGSPPPLGHGRHAQPPLQAP